MIFDLFKQAIDEKLILTVSFDSFEKGVIERKCIPFDFGPSRKYKDNQERYHFYDLNSPEGKHNLSILPSQIRNIELSSLTFDPKDYITWEPNWFLRRDWGVYS